MKKLGTGLLVLSSLLLLSSTMLTAINKDNEIEKLKSANVNTNSEENKSMEDVGNGEQEINNNENNETIDVDIASITVQELDNIYIVAKDKFAQGVLVTDELSNEMDSYFTVNGKSELQSFYITDENGTKICTDVESCGARDNAFTSTNVTYGDMTITEQNNDVIITMVKVANVTEDGQTEYIDKYPITFKYENNVWKIEKFVLE